MRNVLRALAWVLGLSTSASPLYAQVGGSYTYAYLELSPSARITALGGYLLATEDDDLTLGYQNPALYNPEMGGRMAFAHAFGPGGIQYGYAAYAGNLKRKELTVGGGLLYRNYGRFDGRDAAGNWQPGFSASEYALQAGTSYRGDKLRYGANLKFLYSQLESYTSIGVAADLGVTFVDTGSLFSAALVMRNIGTQLTAYTPGDREALPFQVNLGISQRLRYLPLRLSLTLHDLQKADIRYDDPNAAQQNTLLFGQDEPDEPTYTADKIFRHVAVGAEFNFGQNVRARFGYDHQTRGELAGDGKPGLTGFSTGFGIRVKQFRFDYAHAITHISGRNNHLTLNVDMAAFGGR
ncbi:MAG: type IX secretion system protein PorQ [Bacteroidetes bacterium]|nr:type IX secretion system protein PorQ [Bacteroidota bacterium]